MTPPKVNYRQLKYQPKHLVATLNPSFIIKTQNEKPPEKVSPPISTTNIAEFKKKFEEQIKLVNK